jgi:hypothetical protein
MPFRIEGMASHAVTMRTSGGRRGAFALDELERLAAILFPRALLVVSGCGTEPTFYRDDPELVKLATRHRAPNVSLTTNAQLLDPEAVDRLVDSVWTKSRSRSTARCARRTGAS